MITVVVGGNKRQQDVHESVKELLDNRLGERITTID
jgi:hypothetical protein